MLGQMATPPWIEVFAAVVILDPAIYLQHLVYHSNDPVEVNPNFEFNFPWWDRMFRTYRTQPALGHREMVVGLDRFRQLPELRLDRMLSQPFRSTTGVT